MVTSLAGPGSVPVPQLLGLDQNPSALTAHETVVTTSLSINREAIHCPILYTAQDLLRDFMAQTPT
jgi:hypothetical protein